MLDNIKEGDFVLIRHKRSLNECKWVYVTSIVKGEEYVFELSGTLLKHNLIGKIYTKFETYSFHSYYCIYQKITDSKEIEELSLIYKLHLLKSS